MKQTMIILLLITGAMRTSAQEQDYSDAKYVYHIDAALEKRLCKEDNRVFVEGNKDKTELYTRKLIKKWGYWKYTNDKGQADFIMTVANNGGFNVFMSYAVFTDPATGKVFYKTPLVNTFARLTFHGKKAAIKKLFRKIRHHVYSED